MKTIENNLNSDHAARPVLNAFQAVRPRGVDLPSAAPIKPNRGREPGLLKGSHVRVMDRNGRRSAPLAPRTGTLTVEGQKAGQASADRRAALVRGGL
ncbi:hypothetical protein AVMA1855_03850 [Acidovorax sp. SUPP1855]|uniref:hypothetical protein n=1 Tax=Acidovorax sp. SUPP1855 TaxID=431774 RepID=UPI0023DE1B57|nr:hypothetical protein [Acidovorax sp. SUPP1855]GKS83244.1 hypothetical protein AVMA1855_03850 [Acidovorax sp. SUPP1855]